MGRELMSTCPPRSPDAWAHESNIIRNGYIAGMDAQGACMFMGYEHMRHERMRLGVPAHSRARSLWLPHIQSSGCPGHLGSNCQLTNRVHPRRAWHADFSTRSMQSSAQHAKQHLGCPTCVNSGCRSARRSSSRKQRAICRQAHAFSRQQPSDLSNSCHLQITRRDGRGWIYFSNSCYGGSV